MRELFRISRRSAGSRTLKKKLNDEGVVIGRFKVRRLMQEMNLISKQPGHYNWERPHAHNQGVAPVIADEKLKTVSGIS